MSLVRVRHSKDGAWQAHGRPATRTKLHMPYDLPLYDGSEPKVGAHYFTQFTPRGGGPVPGKYWEDWWTPPGKVENGRDHRLTGGFVRDMPLFPDGLATTGDYMLVDLKREVRDAVAAGLDLWMLNLLTLTPSGVLHWDWVMKMGEAVEAVNDEDGTDFKIMLMPDGAAPAGYWVRPEEGVVDVDASADALADHVYTFLTTYPDVVYKHPDGHVVIGPFGPEITPTLAGGARYTKTTGGDFVPEDRPAFWARFKNRLQNPSSAGLSGRTPFTIDLWACFVGVWTTYAAMMEAYDPTLFYGYGRWGERDVIASSSGSNQNRAAATYCHDTYGKKWMHFAAPMDSRPPNDTSTWYRTWESRGSRQFFASFEAGIGVDDNDPADIIQCVTWNDYTENAHISVSENHGWVWSDLATYLGAKYKTGAYPVVKRDGLYLFHRLHRSTATYDAASLQVSRWVIAGSTPVADIVEVLAFLTDAATVEILHNGSVISTQEVLVPGVHSLTCPLPSTAGILSARAVRSGSTVPGTLVTSEQSLRPSPIMWDDMHYRAYSSLRQHTGVTWQA